LVVVGVRAALVAAKLAQNHSHVFPRVRFAGVTPAGFSGGLSGVDGGHGVLKIGMY
jgi:hypothetical protein